VACAEEVAVDVAADVAVIKIAYAIGDGLGGPVK
jgi:hypothetical protein